MVAPYWPNSIRLCSALAMQVVIVARGTKLAQDEGIGIYNITLEWVWGLYSHFTKFNVNSHDTSGDSVTANSVAPHIPSTPPISLPPSSVLPSHFSSSVSPHDGHQSLRQCTSGTLLFDDPLAVSHAAVADTQLSIPVSPVGGCLPR